MLLRRVIEHVKAQNWTAVALDFVIVVVGVFIGIQVSNWNDGRIDRQDEAKFLRALHDDLIVAEKLTGRVLDRRVNIYSNLQDAVDVVFKRAPEREITADECLALSASHVIYVGRADLPALIRLQSAGRTGIIRDEDLAQALASLTQKREAMEVATAYLQTLLVNVSHSHADIFRWTPIEMAVANSPNEMERDLEAACDIERLIDTPQAMNAIAMNHELFDAFLRDGLLPWAAQSRYVHERLDQLLDIQHEAETK